MVVTKLFNINGIYKSMFVEYVHYDKLPILLFKRMKQSKDPFEAAFEESPPESPIETEPDPDASIENPNSTNSSLPQSSLTHEEDHNHIKTPNSNNTITKHKDEEDDEEEDNMDVELAKFPTAGDPHKMAKMQLVLTFFFSLCCFVLNVLL